MRLVTTFCLSLSLLAATATIADESFRPEAGKFPPEEEATALSGELVFVDHANRRGSIRPPADLNYRSAPRPFAMLPYGMVRRHGAPADLRDIPLGTILHGRFYLPPNPKLSSVPNVDEANHAILLEDEPSYCLREGMVWKLKEVDLKEGKGTVVAIRERKEGGAERGREQKLTMDATTRFWRGREQLALEDLIAEDAWPAEGKESLGDLAVLLGLTWQPAGTWARRVQHDYHISDIWLDETAMQRAAQHQTEVHKALIRSRWMPAWVDGVEYGEFGRATVTATLFGGMDSSLYAEFEKGTEGQIGASELTLKHSSGNYGQAHMAIRGPIVDVTKSAGDVPSGSSGIQIRINVDLVVEGFRPGNIVRIRPLNWPDDAVPREEFLPDGNFSHEERFPTPDIFPKY